MNIKTAAKHSTVRGIMTFARGKKGPMLLSALLSILGVVSGLVPYLIIGQIAGNYLAGNLTYQGLLLWVVLSALAYILQGILHGGSTLLSHRYTFEILENIRQSVTDKMSRLSMGTIRKYSSGEYKNLVLDEVEKLEYPLAHAIPEVTGNLSAFLITFSLMLFMNVRLAFSALITVPIGLIIMKAMFRGYGQRYAQFMKAGEALNQTVVEYIDGIDVIKIFNQADSSFEKLHQAVNYYKEFTLAWYRHNWPCNSAYYVILPSAIAGVLPVGMVLLGQGEISLATLLLFFLLSFALIPPLIKLTEFIDNFAVIVKTEREVHDFLEQEEPQYASVPVTINNFRITLENVRFSYNQSLALDSVSAEFPSPGVTAIVGESGAGKSTLLRLIARFWEIDSGRICIGGRDVREIPQEQLMNIISIVDQDNFLFDMSICDNILLGKPGATKEEISEAVRASGCEEIIHRLKEGLDTVVGSGGDLLSGGERQRVCIARAILKNAPILLLDEPTASMDMENERKVQMALQKLVQEKTVIMVAHRLKTVAGAKQILVMDHGKLIDTGNHDALLGRCPYYARLWNACVSADKWSIGRCEHD